MRNAMEIRAQAKINWSLDVVGRRADGYHLLDGVMQPLTLHDTLILRPGEGLSLEIDGAPGLSAGADNLVLRAAQALREAGNMPEAGARILLQKRIPMGAGLGGGSADCAAALNGLNAFWNLHLPPEALLRIGEKLGADVPFCLQRRTCRAQGIGEKLTPVPCRRAFPLVLLQPCEPLSTREVFAAFHTQVCAVHPDTKGVIAALAAGDLKKLDACAGNVLEAASLPLRPAIGEAKKALLAHGAAMARMTGSGSAVFGVFDDPAAARRAFDALRGTYPTCILTETAVEGMIA